MAGLPLVRGLIDTPVLLKYRNGNTDAMQFFVLVRQVSQPEFSQLSALELIANCSGAVELGGIRVFFQSSRIHPITASISRRAYMILDRLPAPARLTPNEAIVASTAIEHRLPLYTLDPNRFAVIPQLTTFRPY